MLFFSVLKDEFCLHCFPFVCVLILFAFSYSAYLFFSFSFFVFVLLLFTVVSYLLSKSFARCYVVVFFLCFSVILFFCCLFDWVCAMCFSFSFVFLYFF